MARDRYEISLWEDYMVDADGDIPAHFEERKVVVIGSDTMTTACRAYEPKLVENINGTNIFTFKMFYIYRDEQTGEKRQNPFLNLLVNERKVKVFWQNKWYDLVIKNIQEDSSGKSITYTCKDLYINELSKNGYNLEFDNELENNQGSAIELGKRIVEGTDWQVDEDNCDFIKQEKEEPLYSAKSKSITAKNESTGETITIEANKKIYIFYSSVLNKTNPCQFLYDPQQEYKQDVNSQLIIDAYCCSMQTEWENEIPTSIVSSMETSVSNSFRGTRLVDSQKMILDPLTDKYVKVYTATQAIQGYDIDINDEIYEYESTEYKDPTFVNNLIVNNKNFSKTEGWIGIGDLNLVGPFQLYPPYTNIEQIATYHAQSCLRIGEGYIYNTGLRDSSNFIPDGIQNGEEYVFRVKARGENGDSPSRGYLNSVETFPHIYKYIYDQGNISITNIQDDYINGNGDWIHNGDWWERTYKCIKSFSRNQIYNQNIGFFLEVSSNCWIEEMEFFPYVMGEVQLTQSEFEANKTLYYTRNDDDTYTQCTASSEYDSNTNYYKRINPGEMDAASVATVTYHYYNHTKNKDATELEDYLYKSTKDWSEKDQLTPNSNEFEKIRSITVKQSNRFNLLQMVAETFECWCRFDIKHRGDPGYPTTETIDGQTFTYTPGQIVYIDGVPQKFITFKKEVGQETGIGFVYGIDLKSISRKIQSDQIVTKTIVSQNNNEFATNGFCTIARSPENPSRDTFILNFDYYTTQGLLSAGTINHDLYISFPWVDKEGTVQGNGQGYYTQLRAINTEYDEITDILVQRKTELTKQESYKTVYESYITSLLEEKTNIENYIKSLASVSTWEDATDYIDKNADQPEIKTHMNAHENCDKNLSQYQSMNIRITDSITKLKAVLEEKEQRQKVLSDKLKEINYAFFKKYSAYIQEGSWIKEDYIDDTLYYLDAESVAYTSSRPQISYNISVARLSSLEEYKNKVFNLGDITYIQDTEFFGYVYLDTDLYQGIRTPYKEKVLISEVTYNFDDPVQDSFKVQNYKTQFEDLFQRITAATQSLQYSSGQYARAANIVEPTGNIKPETLQNSMLYSANLVQSAQNEDIVQDNTGITLTDTTNPNKMTKITSGGIFISTDGGESWKNAVRGEGISTQYLTAGNINVQNINIIDGIHQTFRWDSTGINAYGQNRNQQQITGVDLSKAVRFDQFGVYGIKGIGNAAQFAPDDVEDIKDSEYVKFGLTWDGLFIKNRYNTHYVEISNENDIQVVDTKQTPSTADDVVRVKIGKLDNNIYGIRLKDGTGTTTLETKQDGTLWLRDSLFIGTDPVTGTYKDGIGYLPIATTPVYYNNNINLDSYHKTNDLTPQSGKQYYYYSSVTHQMEQFSGNTFDSNIIYYESYNEHRTIDMNNKFVVWEDGTMYAKDGYFEGTINATSGVFSGELSGATGTFTGTVQAGSIIASSVHIGGNSGPTMEQVGESAYKVIIESSNGTIFKNGEGSKILTAKLYKGADEIVTGIFNYAWYKNGASLVPTTKQITVSADSLDSIYVYDCVVTYTPPSI